MDLSHLQALPPGGARILSDVTNPLLGPAGAASVFGPQKGATTDDIPVMDAGLARLVRGPRRLGRDSRERGLRAEPGTVCSPGAR